MSTTVWWVLSVVWIGDNGLHNMLALADTNGSRYTSEADCVASAAYISHHLNLSPKNFRYQCHEMDVVVDQIHNTVFLKFPEL